MQAASRDVQLIFLGGCLAYTVHVLMQHRWWDSFMGVIFILVFTGMAWPIHVFASQSDANEKQS